MTIAGFDLAKPTLRNRETRPIYQESESDLGAGELGSDGAEVCEGDAA
jgi:hypothetical protein